MDQHLTVKEATQFTGKSESTIKRLIREIVNEPQHPDRRYILPAHDELEQRKAAGEPYAWKIDKVLLLSRFPEQPMAGKSQAPSDDSPPQASGSSDRIITVLEKTVAMLEAELGEKNKQITAFQERQREQNLLLKNLHEQLPSGSASARQQDVVVDRERRSEQGSEAVQSPESARSKNSIWTRKLHLFRTRHG